MTINMSAFDLRTPVVLLVFNRPEKTRLVFERIREAKPSQLLIIADGPRDNCFGEAEKCKEVRAIAEAVDWDCQVIRNYAEKNLGCKNRVSSGLTWAFGIVKEAIILEDDCLPHPTFFRFCQEMLERYRNDTRIMTISGDNFQFGYRKNDDSYYFSQFTHVWGWATWRRVWLAVL